MKRFLSCMAALCLMTCASFAETGAVTWAYQDIGPVHQAIASWRIGGGTGGAVTNKLAIGSSMALWGTLDRVVFVPSATAATMPDAYSVTLKDAQGIDLFNGQASALTSNANVCALYGKSVVGTTNVAYPFTFAGPLTLNATNDVAGSTNRSGQVILYYRVGP